MEGQIVEKKRYWLRIGLIFFVIVLIFSLYYSVIVVKNLFQAPGTGLEREPLSSKIIPFLNFIPGFTLISLSSNGKLISIFIESIILSLSYGLIGVLIGWIYGKIKNRKQEQIQ